MRRVFEASLATVLVSLSVLCGACASRQQTTVTASDLSTGERNAAFQMAAARCDRQTPACGASPSRDACIQQKLVPTAADVSLENCSSDIDAQNLNACVMQIRAGQCGTGIVHIEACSHDRLCPGVAEEEGTL